MQKPVQNDMLPTAPGLFASLLLAKSSGGFVHVRAQCPSCPHLAHIVRPKSLRFEKRLGAPVFIGRWCVVVTEVLVLSVIAFGPGLSAPVLGGSGL